MTKYLGIDYGAKRIGVAVSDDKGTIAFPRATINNDADALESLAHLVASEKIGSIVVGDTRSFSNLANPVTKEAEDFVVRLKKELLLPVTSVWEAGSSIEASRYAPESASHSDGAAAAIILQRFFDMRKQT
ncbi:MAG: Holliday junction resolvase RuvX [bacterium]|nr:Holliday junction resolvase RuvX [bacterium]